MSISSNPTAEAQAASHGARDMAKSLPVGRITRPPSHPGEIIADILDDNRVSMRAAAKAIGMSPTGLEKVLKGKSPVTPETALKLEAYFGNDGGAVLWLDLQRDYDLARARTALAGKLAAIVALPNSHPAPARKAS